MKSTLLTIIFTFFFFGYGSTQIHLITIHKNQRVVSLQMTASEYSSWITNDEYTYNSAKRQELIQDIYQIFDDKFDFIFLILNEATVPPNLKYYGELIATSNATTGIGLTISNDDAIYGSSGKLKATMALSGKNFLLNGPSLHELAHNWANFIIPTKNWDGSTEISGIPHWGFTGGSTNGQLGGFQQSTLKENIGGNINKYSANNFGTIANGGNSVPYSDLELYLMGMIPLTDVADFDVFSGLSQYANVGSTTEFTASTKVTYDNAKVLAAAGGPRNPSNATSQKNFRLLVVVLTPMPLTTTDWATVDGQSEKFGRLSSIGPNNYNFWEATRGLGSIETGNLNNALRTSPVFPKPRNFNAMVQNNQVLLKWNTPFLTNQTLLGYNVYLEGASTPLNTTLITDTTYLTPIPGQEIVYTYKLKAMYKQGESVLVNSAFRNTNFPIMSDSLALVALYNKCNGSNWTKKLNWLMGPIKTWQGVTVYNNRVSTLNLNSVGLLGNIPNELSNLTELTTLDLSHNQITGSLPSSWSLLMKLQTLYLSSNQITGLLPESWSSLGNLLYLNLNGNQLTGSLPSSWSSLGNLHYLWLDVNQLTGSLPSSWSSLSNLEYLYLSNNQIKSLPDLTHLTNLKLLYVGNNLLDFGDIEPNISVPNRGFGYSPQANIGKTDTIIKKKGDEFRISVTVGGKNNTYQWYKNGYSINGAIGSEYLKPSVSIGDAGKYNCQINNNIATQLTLTSNPITLKISNQAPIANAGPDQTVYAGSIITLDGSASTDLDGDPLTYKWTAPSGITLSSTTAAKPTFTAPIVTVNTNYTFSLVVNDGTIDSPADQIVIIVNSSPATASSIIGNASVCKGGIETYTISVIGGATSYIWTLPTGATGTSSTNTINVTFGISAVSGNIKVKGHNSVGDGTESVLALTLINIPSVAGTVTGNASVCKGGTETYSVPTITGATSYIWTLPTGATGTSSTNSINVTYGTSATSGNIIVKGGNACGNGVSNSLAITVISKPITPIIIAKFDSLVSDAPKGNQWYENGTIISNATKASYKPTKNSTYYSVVSLNGCSSDQSNTINFTTVGIAEEKDISIKIMPNPNDGSFTFVYKTAGNESIKLIELYNSMGVKLKVLSTAVQGTDFNQQFNLQYLPQGVYSLAITTQNRTYALKFIIMK